MGMGWDGDGQDCQDGDGPGWIGFPGWGWGRDGMGYPAIGQDMDGWGGGVGQDC